MAKPLPKANKAAARGTWRGLLIAALAGLALVPVTAWIFPYAVLATDLARGVPSSCDSASTWSYHRSAHMMEEERTKATAEVRVIATDPAFDIVKVRTAGRDFWVPRKGATLAGLELIAYLLAEHRWMEKANPSHQVQPGAIVLDCGAHVGIFTDSALRRGAAKVIAFEIDPVNLECLRRNFAKEIAENRVVVVAKGVWSSETTMDFTISTQNSGMGSLVVHDQGTTTIPVPLIPIDTALAELHIPRVDFIKMDIEGAEREALAGAAQTLRQFKPTLALDSYHRPDDSVVLPRIILGANSGYSVVCGPCERTDDSYQPHVLYYR